MPSNDTPPPCKGPYRQAIGRERSNAIFGVAFGLEVDGGNWWVRPSKGGSRSQWQSLM